MIRKGKDGEFELAMLLEPEVTVIIGQFSTKIFCSSICTKEAVKTGEKV